MSDTRSKRAHARFERYMPDIPMLYIDDTLIVATKPAGLPTLPDGYDKTAPLPRRRVDRAVRARLDRASA